jgi:hypothetical protein
MQSLKTVRTVLMGRYPGPEGPGPECRHPTCLWVTVLSVRVGVRSASPVMVVALLPRASDGGDQAGQQGVVGMVGPDEDDLFARLVDDFPNVVPLGHEADHPLMSEKKGRGRL